MLATIATLDKLILDVEKSPASRNAPSDSQIQSHSIESERKSPEARSDIARIVLFRNTRIGPRTFLNQIESISSARLIEN